MAINLSSISCMISGFSVKKFLLFSAPWTEPHITIGIPRTALFNDVVIYGHVQENIEVGNTLTKDDGEFNGLKWRSKFVFHNSHSGSGAYHLSIAAGFFDCTA